MSVPIPSVGVDALEKLSPYKWYNITYVALPSKTLQVTIRRFAIPCPGCGLDFVEREGDTKESSGMIAGFQVIAISSEFDNNDIESFLEQV